MDSKPFLIGGRWRTTENLQDVRDPFTGEVVARVSYASGSDVEEAIAVASATAPEMRALPRYEVAEALRRLADHIQAQREGVRYAMEEMTEPRLIVIDPRH